MPNINEFIKKEKLIGPELEKIPGVKPCKTCEENVNEAFWDAVKLEMTWTCKNGHLNMVRLS